LRKTEGRRTWIDPRRVATFVRVVAAGSLSGCALVSAMVLEAETGKRNAKSEYQVGFG
jgi:hypothetical protein